MGHIQIAKMWDVTKILVCSVIVIGVLPDFLFCKDLQIPCDFDSRNSSCPAGYCCVRDDFVFTETYCKQLGSDGSSCLITGPSHFECHCKDGYKCTPNIQGHHSSVFGKCRAISGLTATENLTTDMMYSGMTTESSSGGKDNVQQGNTAQTNGGKDNVPIG